MNICLIAPRLSCRLGLRYIQSYLNIKGFNDVSVHLSVATDEKRVRRLLASDKPDIVGISCFTLYRYEAFSIAQWTRSCLPRAKVVLGGVHATFLHKEILTTFDCVDYIVLGEGEVTMHDLACCLRDGGDPTNVKGLALRHDGRVIVTGPRSPIENLDVLPFPKQRPHFDPDSQKHRYASMITSRGCNRGCTYCSNPRFYGALRSRSPQNIVDEMEQLVAKQRVNYIGFFDDTFAFDYRRCVDICNEILRRNLHVPFRIRTRVDTVDQSLVMLLARAGCETIGLGIESGSPDILRNINKQITLDQVGKVFAWARQAGIQREAFFMVGNVGETDQTIEQTVRLIQKIKPDKATVSRGVYLFPGTRAFEHAKKIGFVDDSVWFGGPPMVLYTKENSPEKLAQWQTRLLLCCFSQKGPFFYMLYLVKTAISLPPEQYLQAGSVFLRALASLLLGWLRKKR